MSERAPITRSYEAQLPANTILQTIVTEVCEVDEAGFVNGVTYFPVADITGANSPASRTLSLINKGQDGNGTTVVATLAFVSGTNGSDFDGIVFTLSAVAGARAVANGDVLAISSAPVGGTGLVDPGGRVEVEVGRTQIG